MVMVLNLSACAPCLSWYSPKYCIWVILLYPTGLAGGQLLWFHRSLLMPWLGWVVYALEDFFTRNCVAFSTPTFSKFFCRLFFTFIDFYSNIKSVQYRQVPMHAHCSIHYTRFQAQYVWVLCSVYCIALLRNTDSTELFHFWSAPTPAPGVKVTFRILFSPIYVRIKASPKSW